MSNLQVGGHWVPKNKNSEVEHLDHAWTPNTAQSVTPQVCSRQENHTIKFAQPNDWIVLYYNQSILLKWTRNLVQKSHAIDSDRTRIGEMRRDPTNRIPHFEWIWEWITRRFQIASELWILIRECPCQAILGEGGGFIPAPGGLGVGHLRLD